MKTFIEIGCCDFDTNLSLIANGEWQGVMVEASPLIFKSLSHKVEQTNNRTNVFCENIAISNRNGTIKFAVAKDSTDWSRGIGTILDPNHEGFCLYTHRDNAHRYYSEVVEVPCNTLDYLVDKYSHLGHIDYLKLDTEGHEVTILKAYSWKIKPTFIKLEHKHVDDRLLVSILESQGYTVYTEAEDIYAII